MQKGFFLICFFVVFWWFCFLLPVFWFLCFVKSPKRLFSCNFRGFLSILFPQKACLKVFLFFLFCFFCCFCLPFQNSILSLCFLAISPFLENINIFGFFFFFFFLLFPFLMFACCFQTNFPNIPFLKSNLLSFLAVSFFCCSCFCIGCVCFSLSVFLLLCWLCFWCFYWFCLVFCFVFFLVLVPVYEKKTVFPAILVFFEFCWLKGQFDFMFYVFVLVCLSCVVSFHFKEIHLYYFASVLIFCDKTKCSSCLHLVVLLPFLFLLFCFEFCLFLLFFSFPSKKDPPKNRTQQKPQKTKMQKNQTKKNQLAQLCSQIVFLNFLGWASNFHFLAENTNKNSGFSIFSNR